VLLVLLAPWLARETLGAPHLASWLALSSLLLFFSGIAGAQQGTLAGFESFKAIASISVIEPKPGAIDGRQIKHKHPLFVLTWRWQSQRHDRYKVLDKYIATPVKSVQITPFSGDVGYMSTADKTMLASNAIVHNGVNLQDTDLALIAFLPYTPGQVVQWEGRFARHGQKRPVLIQYLIAENTVDEHVAGILLDKLPAVEKVSKDDSLDGFSDAILGSEQTDEIMDSILSKLDGHAVVEE
jgi:hypothetical protein